MAHTTGRSPSISTPVIRGAYFYLHEKRTKDGNKNPIPEDKQGYEFTGIIPKLNSDPMQCPNYKIFSDLAMQAVAAAPEWRGQWPAGGRWPIKDGDQNADKYPWQKGHWVIKFSSRYPSRVCVLENGRIRDLLARQNAARQDEYKSGDYIVVSTYAFTYDNQQKGVKFDIEGVMFVGAGEAIGQVQRTAEQMFAGVAGSVALPPGAAPIGAAPAPGYGGMPPGATPQIAAPQPQYAQPAPPAAPVVPAPQHYAPPPPPAPMAPGALPPIPGR